MNPPPISWRNLKPTESLLSMLGTSWAIASMGREHKLALGDLATLQRIASAAEACHDSVSVAPPAHAAIVIRSPSGRVPSPAPNIVIRDHSTVCAWLLSEPALPQQISAVASALAQACSGHRVCSIPLPGTLWFNRSVSGIVHMAPPGRTPYSIIDGKLVAPAKQTRKKVADPNALSVPLGASPDGSEVSWAPGRQSNGFCLVLGASGSGKTETLKVLGNGIHRYGVPLLILDFHGDVRVPGVKNVLLSSGTDSTLGLNPMELDGSCGRESGLFDQRGALREMIQRACPALGHKQRNALREAIERAYIAAGILDSEPETWGRMPPTFADLMQGIEDEGLKAGVAELFGHPIFRRTENFGIDNTLSKSSRLDLSRLSDGVRFVAAETLLQRIFRALRLRGAIHTSPASDRERFRLFVMIDEAKILAMGGGANILDTLMTEARKFGLGIILASQMAEHFSEEVRANAATWIVLRPQAMKEAQRNAPNVGVAAEALMVLKGRGDGYYRDQATNGSVRLQVRALSPVK